MLLKTHLAFAFLLVIFFLEHVNNKIIFVLMVILGSIIPDLDSGFSSWGRHLIFRPLQFFVKHRGIVHSFTAAFAISLFLAFTWPITSLGFFVGYSVHLIMDSFTYEGVQPFWPLRTKSKGFFKTGGRIEESIFFSLVMIDIVVFFLVFILNQV
ncbi:metal-dependent hydrolase [Candidatus Pacearchaeota archaeon]|nr:metal-dependent hydrolase [Candidatus Pacearchaeota archaeon]